MKALHQVWREQLRLLYLHDPIKMMVYVIQGITMMVIVPRFNKLKIFTMKQRLSSTNV